MKVEIVKVPTNHSDLLTLVDELNQFFVNEWGEDINNSYAKHHQLDKMNAAFVAYVNGQAVGCGCWKLLDQETPEIKRMFVNPDYRGQQISQKILSVIEDDIKSNGFKKSVLETGSEMNQAIRFYEKQGYVIIPNFGEFINDDQCVCLSKVL